MSKMQTVLITGADGFIGKNLFVRLKEQAEVQILSFIRGNSTEALLAMVEKADAIVHLAGENRPSNVADFARVNTELTRPLCNAIRASGRNIPFILISSTQAAYDNPYGKSKLAAEQLAETLASETNNSTIIYRLPGVFGKWCKPNYNSVVATFCHNISRDLPIQIDDPAKTLQLVYIDDVVDELLRALVTKKSGLCKVDINQKYTITLSELAEQITAFKNCRTSLISERVGTGLTRALYATYISYLPPKNFVYDLPRHSDERGTFVEMLKTPDCGQFSFFTVHPGITRGSHYHHTKTEKFLVVNGVARMRFRHMITGEMCDITISSDKAQVVESIPGWVHDITNIGESEAIIMLWANEVFDHQRPDCIPCEV
jgi:UDP-2-acetamido-2,6-beta-L-arabino-hexul-4-ose reductase